MPTGYTEMIEDGNVNAREYVEKCSKAFGLFIHMRDESLDKPISYPTVGDYHFKSLEESRDRLRNAKSWTKDQIDARHKSYMRKEALRQEEAREKHDRIKANYDSVKAKLAEWNPQDEVSQNIKKFALEQIALCYTEGDYKPYIQIETDVNVWYNHEVSAIQRSIDWTLEDLAKETQRNIDRVSAIDTFRQELSQVPR